MNRSGAARLEAERQGRRVREARARAEEEEAKIAAAANAPRSGTRTPRRKRSADGRVQAERDQKLEIEAPRQSGSDKAGSGTARASRIPTRCGGGSGPNGG